MVISQYKHCTIVLYHHILYHDISRIMIIVTSLEIRYINNGSITYTVPFALVSWLLLLESLLHAMCDLPSSLVTVWSGRQAGNQTKFQNSISETLLPCLTIDGLVKGIFVMYDISKLIFKGNILDGVYHFWGNLYLDNIHDSI